MKIILYLSLLLIVNGFLPKEPLNNLLINKALYNSLFEKLSVEILDETKLMTELVTFDGHTINPFYMISALYLGINKNTTNTDNKLIKLETYKRHKRNIKQLTFIVFLIFIKNIESVV